MQSIQATVWFVISLVFSLSLVMVLTIGVRRILINVAKYRGAPLLAASTAIATLLASSLLVLLEQTVHAAWVQVPIATTVLAGAVIGIFLLTRKLR